MGQVVNDYGTLVSASELAQHLNDPRWIIFDCRFSLADAEAGRRQYMEAHIPGARYADLDRDLASPVTAASGRHPMPDPDLLAQHLAAWGVNQESQVIVYDDVAGAIAARMWWLLRWLGHSNVAVLDGGYPQWQNEGRPCTARLPDIKPGNFHGVPRDAEWIDVDALQSGLNANTLTLIDARSAERFRGEHEPIDPVAGHIPGALNIPFDQNLASDGRFLHPDELLQSFVKWKNTDPKNIIHMCGSGVTACHNLLAMEIAGIQGSRLYVGSWSEWIRSPQRPVVRGVTG